MTIYIAQLSDDDYTFPSVYTALTEPNGLLAFGGDLSPQRIKLAYQSGIFPWYSSGDPILWWSPTPRAVFIPKTYNPSKSLKKYQKKVGYRISINHDTASVIDYCASTRGPEETWIHPEMRLAYKSLAHEGVCHSVEVWNKENQLVGGFYGISIGKIFCGESMFSLETNTSKIALWKFCEHFLACGGELIDCQIMNPHLLSLGAKELKRDIFHQQLTSLKDESVDSKCYLPQWLSV
ncbi:leucyl/phenylalanyl-tRNA--protein transferase [Vibrio sp. RC27]